jgi:hypothetical protein
MRLFTARAVRWLAALPLAAALAACGASAGPPGAEDARAALKAAVLANPTAQNNAYYRMLRDYTGDRAPLRDPGQLAGLLDRPKIEVSQCTSAGDAAGYYCDYRIGWKAVLPPPDGITIPDWSNWYHARFFRSDSGWNYEERR